MRSEYQKKYQEEYRPRKRVQERLLRERRKREAVVYLGGKCLDCGTADERLLVFDHVRGEKVSNVTTILGKAWEKLEAELQKCDLVCANCHLIRTKERIPKAEDTFVGRVERRTHCPKGHPRTEENTYTCKNKRWCLICKRIRNREYARERRSKTRRIDN